MKTFCSALRLSVTFLILLACYKGICRALSDEPILAELLASSQKNVSLTFSAKPACPGKTVVLTCKVYGMDQVWFYMDKVVKWYLPSYMTGYYEQVTQNIPTNVTIYSLLASVINDTGGNAVFTSIWEVGSEYVVNDDIGCSSLSETETYVYKVLGPPPAPNITSCEMLLTTSSYSIYNITWEQEGISNEDIAYHEIIINQTDPFNATKIYPGVNSAIIRIYGGYNNSITVKVVDKCEQTNEDNISLTDCTDQTMLCEVTTTIDDSKSLGVMSTPLASALLSLMAFLHNF